MSTRTKKAAPKQSAIHKTIYKVELAIARTERKLRELRRIRAYLRRNP